jgi:hypothetical protein
MKNEMKNKHFDVYHLIQKFSVCDVFWVNILAFFQQTRNQLKILSFTYPYQKGLFAKKLCQSHLHIWQTLTPDAHETLKRSKNVFSESVIEFHFLSLSGLGDSIVNIDVPKGEWNTIAGSKHS